jgi:hypothetical protein
MTFIIIVEVSFSVNVFPNTYSRTFGQEQYKYLARRAKEIHGKMIIRVNNVPKMRSVFKGLKITTDGINYSLGCKFGQPAKRQELIIKNWSGLCYTLKYAVRCPSCNADFLRSI